MKTIRIAGGIRQIEQADPNFTLSRIQEVLSEHRALLITGVLGQLADYVCYKFSFWPDKEKLGILRNSLTNLAESKVILRRYGSIVKDIQESEVYRVPTKDFFLEIDELLNLQVHLPRLPLVS